MTDEKKLPEQYRPFDLAALFRVEVYGDGICNDLVVRAPVMLVDGTPVPDVSRKARYFSQGQVQVQAFPGMTPQTVPVPYEIEAVSVADAFEKNPGAAKKAIDKWIEDYKTNEAKRRILEPAMSGMGMPRGKPN